MTPRQFLEACEWGRRAGGQYYYPAHGHPHLHLGTDGVGMESGNIGDMSTRANKMAGWQNLTPKIRFVAISNGNNGRNFIENGRPTHRVNDPKSHITQVAGDDERAAEIAYELEYILRAYGYGL